MLQAELGNLALKDELTGFFNRRGFQALAERQLKLGRRSGRAMLLFFIDVDGLKQINDSFGHAEGDQALKRTAETLEKTFRDSDVIARLGGDEFAVLAIEASGHSEARILARLQKYLKTVNAREVQYAVSLSVGVARFDHGKPISIRDLMAQADQAMYEQKRGRSSSRIAVRKAINVNSCGGGAWSASPTSHPPVIWQPRSSGRSISRPSSDSNGAIDSLVEIDSQGS
jgi:diguanylate cyclase (GGDEF)-like protein